MPHLLILSVSAGNGHVRAAQALAATAEALEPLCTVTHLDAMQYVAGGFRKIYTDWYVQLVNRAPDLWSYIHQKTDSTPHSALSQRLRRGIERISAGALLREVHRLKPDAIVCTHFLPAELLLRERTRGRLKCPVWLQATDYDLHNMWIVPGMTGYLAANDEVAFRMRARGISCERVHITGIPVMPCFSRPDTAELARDACIARLGLDRSRKVVLIASGGTGRDDLPSMVERLLALQGSDRDFQVIAVAGRNLAAHAALKKLAQRMPATLMAVGFTDDMATLMAAADLVVTKPGGLTISECLVLGKPMLLVSPVPGQEEHNAGFLLEQGVARLAYDSIGFEYKIARLLAAPDDLALMSRNSRALGRPDAARRVLDCVLAA